MAYSTQADLERAAGSAERLVQLCDRNTDGTLDAAALDLVIEEQDRLIDSYVGKKRQTPLATPSAVIRRISAVLTVYALKEQRQALTARDDERRTEQIDLLEGMSFGRIAIGDDDVPPAGAQLLPEFGERDGEAAEDGSFNRDDLGGLW